MCAHCVFVNCACNLEDAIEIFTESSSERDAILCIDDLKGLEECKSIVNKEIESLKGLLSVIESELEKRSNEENNEQ